ncbi:MAG: HAMP domain-containing histidine kinase [Bacteroidales bacterium]|nr:HAMP domain-containing histidine kinase [Bacteroidales bacterium]
MKRHAIRIIIILTTLSVAGIIATQAFWIRKSWRISQGQYDHRADEALNDVIDELKDYTDSTFRVSHHLPCLKDRKKSGTVLDIIDTAILDELMRKYTDYHMLSSDYEYAVIRTKDNFVLYSTAGYSRIRPKCNPYKACLSCIWKDGYYHLSLCFRNQKKMILIELSMWLFWSSLFIIIIIFSFSYVIYTIFRQKKLSEMKNDFINNMTHEFKTPISTISLASEVLLNSESGCPVERIKKYSKIIFDENQRMRYQVERVLSMAQHEKGELKLYKTTVDIHELITNTTNNMFFGDEEKRMQIKYRFGATNTFMNLDELHISNVIKNIVENAYKYSGEDPVLEIITTDSQNGVLISFKDNGKGMSHETQKHIFEKFYRIPTGNIHNVKGFGLGLYYVRTMVEAHNGFVSVTSELNKGTRFDVYLPGNA